MMILRGMQINKMEQELNKFAYNLCGKKKSYWQAAGTAQAGGIAFLKRLYLLWVADICMLAQFPVVRN